MNDLKMNLKDTLINVLEFITYNKWVDRISTSIIVFFLVLSLSKVEIIVNGINILNIVWVLIWTEIFISIYYKDYKQEKTIDKLQQELIDINNTNNTITVNPQLFKEELANLMHSIWADDVMDFEYSTSYEEMMANMSYDLLSDKDKQVNLNKAQSVINLVAKYK